MTARRTLPAVAVVAVVALMAAGSTYAQEPAPAPEPQEVAVPRPRARAERSGDDESARPVRAPRRVDGDAAGSAEARPRNRAAAPSPAPSTSAANAEEQGGARRRPSGGGGGSVGGGRSGRGGGGDGGAIRSRPGGVRNPDVGSGGSRAQAIPRSRAPRPVYAAPSYSRRLYYGPSGLGYYVYDPWSWYGYGGWGGWGAWGGYYGSNWGGYYGNNWGGYYGAGPGYYGGGYGGVYGGPSGWSIGGVRLKVKPRDAEVYVDGYYAGIVDDFDGMWQQLRLDDGGHRIEVRMPGLAPLTFDVMVQPGRTITYRGDLTVTP
jgi:hypothetical protein